MKPNKQIKRKIVCSLANNIIYINIIMQTFQAFITFETNEYFDLVAASHELIHISPSDKLICTSTSYINIVQLAIC